MSIEDVVLVSTVREDIRSHVLQVDSAEIPLRVEAEQLGARGLEIPVHLRFPKREASSTVDLKRSSAHNGNGELSAGEEAPGVSKGKPTRPMKSGQGEVAATGIVETGTEELMINNKGIQRGDPEEDDNGAPGSAASPVLPSYPVGRGISLPFGQLLPKCDACSCSALITWSRRCNPKKNGVVCLDHGLHEGWATRDLALLDNKSRYHFISPEHEAAIRAFLT